MLRLWAFAITVLLLCPLESSAQQSFRAPDVSSMKHLTSRGSDRARDIPGDETTLDYYSAPKSQIVSVYTYRGRTIAWSVHSNSDPTNSMRLFVDTSGDGFFQEINRSAPWTIPPWARR